MKNRIAQLAEKLPWRSLARWWVVGMVFLGIGTAFLYVAKALLHMPVIVATPVSAEVTLLVRFLINDSWVFGQQRPSWKRLWQFHVASAGGFVIWMVLTNGLYQVGVHYLVASVVGSACSMFFSIATNFLWIWRQRTAPVAAGGAD
jgi:putative flippase GtrA